MSRNNKALPRPTMPAPRRGNDSEIIAEYNRVTLYAGIIIGLFFGLCCIWQALA